MQGTRTSAALLALLLLPLRASPAPREDASTLVTQIKQGMETADPALIQRLAEVRTKEALDGLLEIYELMSSVFMRQMVLEGLRLFDEVPGLERIALQKMTDVATEATDRELRERAVDLLAACGNYGKAFLVMIVESSAEDAIRERAMQHHVGTVRDEDLVWYGDIYEPDEEAKAKARKGKIEEEQVPYQLPELRKLAFEALAASLSKEEVLAALQDRNRHIRLRALEELANRGEDEAMEEAERLYEQSNAIPGDRLAAAKILARGRGEGAAQAFLKDGGKSNMPEELVFGLADILAEMNDPEVNEEIIKLAGKSKGMKLTFFLRASRHLEDPKLDKALIKLLDDEDPTVQNDVIHALVDHRSKDAVPALEELMLESEEPLVVSAAVAGISTLRGDDPAWTERLLELSKGEEPNRRNAALEAIAKTRNPDYLELLIKALDAEQWSTRLTAARGLETMKLRPGVEALVRRIQQEEGRMALELSNILWRMTGQPFRTNGKLWEKWWQEQGANFQVISESELHKLAKEEELRRLRETTKSPSSFFGIRILSHRVIFVLDISGSMAELTRGKWVGSNGDPRFDVARRELSNALDSLDRNSLFNVIVFSSEVSSWQDRISEFNPTTLQEAKDYIARLGAAGGTNIHGALRFAFEDPDVDTIYFLSDGEPSEGEVIDPHAIRREVARWRENRDVTIHTVAVGGSLQLLEWLAEDTGGTHVSIP